MVAAFVARFGPKEGVQRAIDVGWQLTRAAMMSMVNTSFLKHSFSGCFEGREYLDLDTVCLPAATEVGTSRLVAFRGTTIAEGIRVSASFPTIYSPSWANDPETGHLTRFVDGAISSFLLDAPLVEEGADFVLGANCISLPSSTRLSQPFSNPVWLRAVETLGWLTRLKDGGRSAFVMMHAASVSDASLAKVVFDSPRLSKGPHAFYAGGAIRDEARAAVEPAVTAAVKAWRAMRARA